MINPTTKYVALDCVNQLQNGYDGTKEAGTKMGETIKAFINTTWDYLEQLESDYDELTNYGGID